MVELRRQIEQEMRDVVERGVAEGAFTTSDPHMTALALLSLGIDVARWYRDEGEWTPAQIADHYCELALRIVGDAPIYLDLRKELLQARFRRDQAYPTCPWVCHRSGKPVSTYRAEWERARSLIGRPGLHFHDLRPATRPGSSKTTYPRSPKPSDWATAYPASGASTATSAPSSSNASSTDCRHAGNAPPDPGVTTPATRKCSPWSRTNR